jgi:thiol-disulfide isomerase/thioredoxin
MIAGGTALVASTFALPGRAHELKPFIASIAAPPLVLQRLDGPGFDLASLGRKPALIAFWATWCPPCRAELPALARLTRDLAPEGWTVLAVNVGEPEDKVRRFLAQIEAEGLAVLLDETRAASVSWRVGGLPIAYGVGPDARMAFSISGAVDWDDPAMRARLREKRLGFGDLAPT